MRAVFLDRDGVISENRADHVKSWEEFRFIPGALTGMRWLHEAGFRVFIVTNQAIINRGLISSQAMEDMHARMLRQIVQNGGFIEDICYCPHDYHEGCACRKPRPGMLQQLAAKWNVDLARAYMVGDAWTDVAAGQAANCRTIMVRTGRGAEQIEQIEEQRSTDYIAADLLDGVSWLFQQEAILLPCHDRDTHIQQPVYLQWNAALS